MGKLGRKNSGQGFEADGVNTNDRVIDSEPSCFACGVSDATKLSYPAHIAGQVGMYPIMDWVGVWRYSTSLEQRKRDISCDDLC